MRRKEVGRNVRKALAGMMTAACVVGSIPVYAAESTDLTQSGAEQVEVSEPEGEEVLDEAVSENDVVVEEQTDITTEEPSENETENPVTDSGDETDDVQNSETEEEAPTETDVPFVEDSEQEKPSVETEIQDEDPTVSVGEEENALEDLETAEEKNTAEDQELPLQTEEEVLPVVEAYEEEYAALEISASGDYVVKVTDYGADGSDKASDSEAIQKALDEAWGGKVPSGSKLVVKVPSGTYYLDTALGIYSNTSLELDAGTVMINDHLLESMLVNSHRNPDNPKELCDPGYAAHNCSHGGYTQGKNITISGGTWDGNVTDPSQMYTSLISLRHAEGITIKNTTLKNGNGLHMLVLDGIKNADVDYVNFENCVYYTGKDDGYYGEVPIKDFGSYTELEKATLAQFKEAVHIDAMNKIGTEILPLDGTVCEDITVQNCTFKNVLAGVGAHHPDLPNGKTHNNIVIQNNTFTGLKGTAVCVMSMKDAVVKGNTADDVYTFANVCQSTVSLSGNKVTNAHDVASYISDKSTVVLDNENYEISLNFLREDEFAVDVQDSSVCTIKNSTIKNGGRGGIGARGSSTITVENTNITVSTKELKTINSSPAGILIDKSSGTLTGNTITGAQGKDYGILIQKNTNQTVSVKNNEITHGYLGIGVLNSLGTIDLTGNTITDMTSNGIWLWESRALIDGNTISNVGDKLAAIQVNSEKIPSGTMMIKNNKINGTYWGIYVTGEKEIRVEGNTVTKCKDVGIRVTKSASIDVVNNTVTGTEKTGNNKAGWDITFWACSSGTCSGNTVTGNPSDNILSDSPGVKISSNGSGASNGDWKKENGSWYLYSQGKKLTGWQKVDGKWYYLDPGNGGKMSTGWKKISNKWYYLDSKAGGAMSTGWKKISNKWYYLDSKAGGAMSTGWKKISNKWYYLDGKAGGAMSTGWKKISNKWYYLDGSGVMKTGWMKQGGKWYYLNSSGVMVTSDTRIDGKINRFNSSGIWLGIR